MRLPTLPQKIHRFQTVAGCATVEYQSVGSAKSRPSAGVSGTLRHCVSCARLRATRATRLDRIAGAARFIACYLASSDKALTCTIDKKLVEYLLELVRKCRRSWVTRLDFFYGILQAEINLYPTFPLMPPIAVQGRGSSNRGKTPAGAAEKTSSLSI